MTQSTIGTQNRFGKLVHFSVVRVISNYKRVKRFRLVDGRSVPISAPPAGHRRVQAIVRLRDGLATRHLDIKK